MSEARSRVAHQPLHPSIRDKLDPEYVSLHDEVLQYVKPSESQGWTPESRKFVSPLGAGAQKDVEVGSITNHEIANGIQARIFTPKGESVSSEGWPCLVWLHGGGWVNGGLNSENGVLRHFCKYLKCVVCTINYRHAPEHLYPTAVEDSLTGLKWLVKSENSKAMSIDTNKLIFGGLSAGGNLMAILSLKARQLETPIRPIFQFFICPVIDNTATIETRWATSRHSPWLTPQRMTWYRERYFGTKDTDRTKEWTASPCFAPDELLRLYPKTFVAVAECDLLAPEGLGFAEHLQQLGVSTEVKIYKGATHSILILAGIHQIGKQLVHDVCERVAAELGISYDRELAKIEKQGNST
ncbi:hypothetical protein H2204_009387 [Knufia peltigerae]|uniref:Alpha/beta hydrolase fold-3 domain-containing protein n=1 Tax=Knufia peltigerae TaxID=1002370 RepID=A0AA38XY30_9EURO|nr:hypothetical protein H2204_009387 [Knufia peltigerae]